MTVRERVILLVSGLGAVGGGVAGAAAALVAALVLKPTTPTTVSDVATMVLAYALVSGIAGAVLGALVSFGFLRRVPLSRIVTFGTSGAFLGLVYGWLGGPWAWHHFGSLGISGMLAGACAARLLTRSNRRSPNIDGSLDMHPSR
jgi:hypothetical protein